MVQFSHPTVKTTALIIWIFVGKVISLLYNMLSQFSQFSCSVALCDPVNHSTPGLPVYHQLPESTQTYVHCVSDAIQPSHPLLSPSPPPLNLSLHQGLFKWVSSLHQLAKVLEFQCQHHSLQRNPRHDLLQNGLVGSPCSPRDSQESSPTPQFKSINSSALSLLHSLVNIKFSVFPSLSSWLVFPQTDNCEIA